MTAIAPLEEQLPAGPVTKAGWASEFLRRLDAPVTTDTVQLVIAWIDGEGTRARYNPLATTQWAPGATIFNSHKVRNYPDLETGFLATLDTITNGRYDTIVAGLRAGDVNAALSDSKEWTTWGTGSAQRLQSLLATVRSSWPAEATDALKAIPPGGSSLPNPTLPPSSGGGSGGGGTVELTGGLIPNPFGDTEKWVRRLAVTAVLVLGGVALLALGGYRLAAPITRGAAT